MTIPAMIQSSPCWTAKGPPASPFDKTQVKHCSLSSARLLLKHTVTFLQRTVLTIKTQKSTSNLLIVFQHTNCPGREKGCSSCHSYLARILLSSHVSGTDHVSVYPSLVDLITKSMVNYGNVDCLERSGLWQRFYKHKQTTEPLTVCVQVLTARLTTFNAASLFWECVITAKHIFRK